MVCLIRNAGVYTGKEIITLAREKSIRLKALYTEELKRTYYSLKELRREYLREARAETSNLIFLCITIIIIL